MKEKFVHESAKRVFQGSELLVRVNGNHFLLLLLHLSCDMDMDDKKRKRGMLFGKKMYDSNTHIMMYANFMECLSMRYENLGKFASVTQAPWHFSRFWLALLLSRHNRLLVIAEQHKTNAEECNLGIISFAHSAQAGIRA